MGGGQAGAPADDDHVPWSRPPRHDHRDLAGHGAGRHGGAGPEPGIRVGLGPVPARKANREGRGEGAENIYQRAAAITMMRLKIN
jgi:hypothetical protein